jgi:hypothetical protein
MSTARSRAAHSLEGVPHQVSGLEHSRALESLPALDLLLACRKLSDYWGFGAEIMADLLGTSRSTWFRWVESAEATRQPLLTGDQRARALALLRIFEASADLHQAAADHQAWPHEVLDGPGFMGRTPLEVMRSHFEGLLLVRDYLNFLLGSWS